MASPRLGQSCLMHRQCAHYALMVCPYLAAPNYSRRIDSCTMSAEERAKIPVLIDNTMDRKRPALFVCAMAHRMTAEFWRHGERLMHEAGLFIARNELARKFSQREVTE
jgi:hypothetical protein